MQPISLPQQFVIADSASSVPRVSVVVPNYNHAHFLRRRVETVLGQSFQDFELVLLDDRSRDGSDSILCSYAGDCRVRIEFNENNSGSTFKQWNKGVRLARAGYVWIAESDDYADAKFLEKTVAFLDANPEVVFVSCRSWRVTGDGHLSGYADSDLVDLARYAQREGFDTDGREECRNYFVRVNPVCNASSVLFRKAVYEQVGGADESLRYCGDWKLWAAMALVGRVAYISEPLNYYRVHDGTVTREGERQGAAVMEYLRVIRWVLKYVVPAPSAQKKLQEALPWYWGPALTARHIPLARRWKMILDAIAIAPTDTLRRVFPVVLGALHRKLLLHWRMFRSTTKSA